MEKEKIDEYNGNVKTMIESYYGLGKVVMGRTGLEDRFEYKCIIYEYSTSI